MILNCNLSRRKAIVTTILLPWFGSCGSRQAEEPKEKKPSGQDSWFPIRIGQTRFQLQLAVSAEEKNKGLMNRKSLPNRHGMLFLSDEPKRQSFWMQSTWIPLDIGFFDPVGALLEVRKLHPHEVKPVKSRSENILFAVELNRNAYREATIELGSKLNVDDLRAALKVRGIDPEIHGL